jgi:hypothetical protein
MYDASEVPSVNLLILLHRPFGGAAWETRQMELITRADGKHYAVLI